MKLLICFLTVLLAWQTSIAQNVPADSAKYELRKKSKSQRTGGFILLGVGAITTFIGVAANVSSNMWGYTLENEKQSSGKGAMVAGLAMMAGSIPLFIAAGKNQRASFAIINVQQLQMNTGLVTVCFKPQLSLTLTKKIF